MDNTYKKLNDQNKKILNDYEKHRLKVKDHKPQTVKIQIQQLSQYLSHLNNKDPKDVTREEILKFLNKYKHSTQVILLIILKPFYRWYLGIKNGNSLPDYITEIERKPEKINETEYRERVITEEEFDKLIEVANGAMYRAIIDTFYHFGVRVSELLSMNTTDVKYDGEITTIVVRDSKSIPRDVDFRGRPEHLMKWFETLQQHKGEKDKPLWTAKNNTTRLTRQVVWHNIKRCAKGAGINRTITDHDFRHTSVTNDRKNGVPTTHIETKHGYRHGTPMMGRYDHNKSKDYQDWLREKKEETDVTYDTLKKQKERLEQKHEKDINDLKDQIEILMGHYKELTGEQS